MTIEAIFLAILAIVLGGSISEILSEQDVIIEITPTTETVVANGFTRHGIYFELKEYQTAEDIILSSFKTLDLNQKVRVKGQVIGTDSGKYVFSVKETVIDLAAFAKK